MTDRRPPSGREEADESTRRADESRESERLLRALRGAVPVEAPEKVAARRRELVAAISREIEAVPARIARQERRRRWLRGALIAAATFALTWTGTALWQTFQGQTSEAAQLEGGDAPNDGQALVTLITQHGTRQDMLSTGQDLTVGRGEQVDAMLPGATRIQFAPLVESEPPADHPSVGQAVLQLNQLQQLNQSLFVKSGALSVDVPESKPSRRLVTVVTPHARVEVKGTQFQVRVSEGASAHTSVSVSRGAVLVSWLGGHTLLTRGQTWRSPGVAQPPQSSTAEPRERDAPSNSLASPGGAQPKGHETHRATTASKGAGTERPAVQTSASASFRSNADDPPQTPVKNGSADGSAESTLGAQNALLQRAMDAEKSGNWHRAAELYDRLIVEHPDSPLRATALSERRRMLQRLGH